MHVFDSLTLRYNAQDALPSQMRLQLLVLPKSLRPDPLLPRTQDTLRIKRILDRFHKAAIRVVIEIVQRSHQICSRSAYSLFRSPNSNNGDLPMVLI